MPQQVLDLLDSVRIKWAAKNLGLERLILKQGKMIGYFVSDQQSAFYQSTVFTKVLNFVQKNPTKCTLKEKDTKSGLKLLLTFDKITNIHTALRTLENMTR